MFGWWCTGRVVIVARVTHGPRVAQGARAVYCPAWAMLTLVGKFSEKWTEDMES